MLHHVLYILIYIWIYMAYMVYIDELRRDENMYYDFANIYVYRYITL